MENRRYLSLALFALTACGSDRDYRSGCPERRFTTQRWTDSAAVYGRQQIRSCIVGNLRRTQKLRGMSRAEIVALLGEPRPTEYFSEFDLVYWVGRERGLVGIDSEWLVFRLDSKGRVIEHRLVTD
jgi:hypothetical protein